METKPLTTKDAAGKAKPAGVEKPAPSQAQADEIREEALAGDEPKTAEEEPKKSKKPAPTSDDPYPTQADLDAMKAGTFEQYVTR